MNKELSILAKKDWVAVEMARRKKVFHKNEKWNEITLWGLFTPSRIRSKLKCGKLISYKETKYKGTGWYSPSKEYWEKSIKPIVDKFTLEELQETF